MEENRSEFKVKGEKLLEIIKQLIHEGNIRRIIIKDDKERVFMEIPLTIGFVGAALLPVLAAVGALAAMVNDFTIVVIKKDEAEKE
ncbi:MAG TPA: DUF4342 domain-containing protein [Bacteroidales bacterium]|nr:DUF4342 domain-containing protein [Bacteroidales bacterium]